MTKYAAKKLLRQYNRERRPIDWDHCQLSEAAYYQWIGDYKNAGRLLFSLSRKIIIEPAFDSEEYRDGERKPDIPFIEQPEEEPPNFEGTINEITAESEDGPERDDDGYLIR